MEYLYCLTNANLTLRVIAFLGQDRRLPLEAVTVLHYQECWIVRLVFKRSLCAQWAGDLEAVMLEFGHPYQPSALVHTVLQRLASGQSALDVMEQYRVSVVSHGQPAQVEIEAFRQHLVDSLGYCPASLA